MSALDDADPTRFRVYQPGLLPPWMDEAGRDWATAQGLLKDALLEAVTAAVAARRASDCPEDALPRLGEDSQIERMPGESSASYRARLRERFPTWQASGTDLGVLLQLEAAGLSVRAKRNNQWDWDGHPGNVAPWWARMWLIVDRPNSFGPPLVCGGGAVCGDGSICGMTGGSLELVAAIRRLAKKWTSSHVLLVNVIVMTGDGWLCGDGHTSGSGGVCGGSAAYLEGW